MNNKILYATVAIICAFLIAGGVLVYNVHYDYGANASINENGEVNYSLSSSISTDCSCVVLSNVDFKSHTYLYYDDGYASFYSQTDQKLFLKTLKDVLEKRNYTNVEYINAVQLKNTIETADPTDSIIVFASGSLPDTVYSESSPELLVDWFDRGGSVYWCGPNIGSKMSTPDKIVDTENGLLTDLVSDGSSGQTVKDASEFSEKMYFSFRECTYGLKKNCDDSLVLGYSSEDYSSASVDKYLNGRIFVVGGNITAVRDAMIYTCAGVASTIMCGVTENTIILTAKEFHKDVGEISGTLNCKANHGDVLYAIFGVPYSSWSKAITL